MLRKRLKDMWWNGLFSVPLQTLLDQVLVDELAACFLPAQMGFFVVWRGQAGDVSRLGERDVCCGRHGEGVRATLWGCGDQLL